MITIQFKDGGCVVTGSNSKDEIISVAANGIDERCIWPDLDKCKTKSEEVLEAHADDEFGAARTLEELNDIVWSMQQQMAINASKMFALKYEQMVADGRLVLQAKD